MPVSYTLLMQPRFRSLLSDGTPNAGGKVYTYQAGTTTLVTTYNDPGLRTANTNPISLDAEGQADIWLSGPYKLVVQTADGVQLYSVDHLFGFAGNLFCSLPEQDQDKLWIWDQVDGKVKNSTLTLAAIEAAVKAFQTVSMLNGGVVAADAGDIQAGTLADKITSSGGVSISVDSDASGHKKIRIDARRTAFIFG